MPMARVSPRFPRYGVCESALDSPRAMSPCFPTAGNSYTRRRRERRPVTSLVRARYSLDLYKSCAFHDEGEGGGGGSRQEVTPDAVIMNRCELTSRLEGPRQIPVSLT